MIPVYIIFTFHIITSITGSRILYVNETYVTQCTKISDLTLARRAKIPPPT